MKVFLPLIAMLLAVLLVGGCFALGLMVISPALPNTDGSPILLILLCAFVLLCIVNRTGAIAYARRHFGMDAEGRQAFLNEERRTATERDPDATLRELGNLALLPLSLLALYFLLILGMAVAVGFARIDLDFKILLLIPLVYLCFMPLFNRLQLVRGKLCREELVPEGEMPHVRALAEKAARTAGVKGKICLQLISDKDVAIKRFGKNTYLVFLGTRALAVASEEELYTAILREFLYYATPAIDRRNALYDRLGELGTAKPRLATWVFDVFFSPADVYLEWTTIFYKFAAIRKLDVTVAACMTENGHATAAFSMMVKQEMWDYFDHEWYAHVKEPIYAHAETPIDYELAVLDAFREAMGRRYGVWCGMVADKIPAQNFAGAPLTEHGRLLGLTLADLPAPTFPSADSPLGRECIRPALSVSHYSTARFEESRRVNYLEPLKLVTDWEASEKNQPSYELSPILNAYLSLYRTADMEALCDDILAREPDFAHALYFKGHCLLGRYDVSGVDCIYRAIDINKNYMREGFELVGTYCRLMGLSDELNTLLRREENVVEAHAAEHDGAGSLSASDRLSRETELEDLPQTLAYMATAGGGCVKRIFLVRKTISEDFFTSAFVLEFTADSTEEQRHDAYTAIFHYLDAADWQYSLFLLNRDTEAAVHKVPDSLVWERES